MLSLFLGIHSSWSKCSEAASEQSRCGQVRRIYWLHPDLDFDWSDPDLGTGLNNCDNDPNPDIPVPDPDHPYHDLYRSNDLQDRTDLQQAPEHPQYLHNSYHILYLSFNTAGLLEPKRKTQRGKHENK